MRDSSSSDLLPSGGGTRRGDRTFGERRLAKRAAIVASRHVFVTTNNSRVSSVGLAVAPMLFNLPTLDRP